MRGSTASAELRWDPQGHGHKFCMKTVLYWFSDEFSTPMPAVLWASAKQKQLSSSIGSQHCYLYHWLIKPIAMDSQLPFPTNKADFHNLNRSHSWTNQTPSHSLCLSSETNHLWFLSWRICWNGRITETQNCTNQRLLWWAWRAKYTRALSIKRCRREKKILYHFFCGC